MQDIYDDVCRPAKPQMVDGEMKVYYGCKRCARKTNIYSIPGDTVGHRRIWPFMLDHGEPRTLEHTISVIERFKHLAKGGKKGVLGQLGLYGGYDIVPGKEYYEVIESIVPKAMPLMCATGVTKMLLRWVYKYICY